MSKMLEFALKAAGIWSREQGDPKKTLEKYVGDIKKNRVDFDEKTEENKKKIVLIKAVLAVFFSNYKGLYKVESEFSRALKKTGNGFKDLKFSFFPRSFTLFIDCPKVLNLRYYDAEGSVDGWIVQKEGDELTFLTLIENENYKAWTGKNLEISEDKTIKELVADENLSFCLKVLVYIYSDGAKLERIKAPIFTQKNPAKLKKAIQKSEYFFPYEIVGHAFHGKNYETEEWSVLGHLRWQPYGPARDMVKLIWISEQVRRRQAETKEIKPHVFAQTKVGEISTESRS